MDYDADISLYLWGIIIGILYHTVVITEENRKVA
jgi:hypothetical protein